MTPPAAGEAYDDLTSGEEGESWRQIEIGLSLFP
jgi:hypothetical protein